MFKAWPKIPRLENEVYHITEKIDGTNACIIVQKYDSLAHSGSIFPLYVNKDYSMCVFAQSRTRLLTLEDDNFGFAKWVALNAEQLIKDLGEGYHFGEWWGYAINRGYNRDLKVFSLFNPTKRSEVCSNVPILCSCSDDLNYHIQQQKDFLISKGSVASEGYMKPEGLIIYAEKAKCYWKVIINK